MSWPSSRMRPALGFSTPVRRLMTVVLPAPFGPISAWRAPASIFSERSRVTLVPRTAFPAPWFPALWSWYVALGDGNDGLSTPEPPDDQVRRPQRPAMQALPADQHDHD